MEENINIRYYVAMDSRVGAKGLSTVYIRFWEGDVKTDFNTTIKWPKSLLDGKNQLLLPRYDGDPDVDAYNARLKHIKTIINKMTTKAYVDDYSIRLNQIIESITNNKVYVNFYLFMTEEIRDRYKSKEISYETYRKHKSSLQRFTEFWGSEYIPMAEITKEKISKFDAYHKSQDKMHNTISAYHKDIKTYINRAVEKRILKENPYKYFKFNFVAGDREALEQEDVTALMVLYEENLLRPDHHEILKRILFSCLTGVRISDTHRLKKENIRDRRLVFRPKKGERFGKLMKVPLNDYAYDLVKDAEEFLFKSYSDDFINETFKIIAARAQIDKHLTYHSTRDTFGTIYIELGGDPFSLKELMGHTNIATTQLYVKMAARKKKSLVQNFNSLIPKK